MLPAKRFFTLKKIKQVQTKIPFCESPLSKEEENPDEFSVPRFLDPFPFHLIMSDLIIYEDLDSLKETFVSPMKNLFNLKHIVSIDSYDSYLLIKFDEVVSHPVSPLELIIARLRSLSNQEAFDLFLKIDKYRSFRDIIIELHSKGPKREILDSFNQQILIDLRQYYSIVQSFSIDEDVFSSFLQEILSKNQHLSVFCLIYNDFKPIIGTQMCGFLLNKTMRRLLCKSDFEITSFDYFFLDKIQYYNCYLKILENFISTKKDDTLFDFIVKTKNGKRKMSFRVEKWYKILKNGEKKIFVFFVEIPENEKKQKKGKDLKLNMQKKKNKAKNIENNEEWKKLVGLYFENIEVEGNMELEEEEKKIN